MRTTVDLPDPLLAEVKALAQATGCTMRDLVIAGLREAVERHRAQRAQPFRLRDASVGGYGLQPGVASLRPDDLRDLVHGETDAWRRP